MSESDLIFEPTRPATDKEQRYLLLFKDRAEELLSNFRDSLAGRSALQISIRNEPNEPLTTSGLNINRHRIKGLLMDYRPMQARGEEIRFKMTCERIASIFGQPEVSNMLDRNLAIWRDTAHLSGWRNYDFETLVSLLFNAQLFHADLNKQAQLAEVRGAFSDESLSTLLFLGVQQRCAAIRNLCYCLGPFAAHRQQIRIPVQASRPQV